MKAYPVSNGMDDQSFRQNLEGALGALQRELHRLRTSRASMELVEDIPVEAYGSVMSVKQVSNISIPEARLILLQAWDKALVPAIEKAVRDAGMNLNPAVDGQMIRVPIPPLTEESRRTYVKIAAEKTEESHVSIRRARQDAFDALDKEEGRNEISEDEKFRARERFQKLVDEYNRKADELFEQKEKEIMAP